MVLRTYIFFISGSGIRILLKPLTKLNDGLVDNLRAILKLICPGKAFAKSSTQKPSTGDIETIFN